MKTKYLIIGGGLSGLIMGMELTKRGEDYQIIERNKVLPEAKLHYLHADLSEYFPFKLRQVDIATNVYWQGHYFAKPTIPMMNRFSCSTINKVVQNSMKYIDGDMHKGWVPDSGIENISNRVLDFNKNKPLVGWNLVDLDNVAHIAHVEYTVVADGQDVPCKEEIEYERIISTVPLPIMLKIAGIEHGVKFATEPLKVIEVKVPEELYEEMYQVTYIPEAEFGITRFSVLGRRVVAEIGHKNLPMQALWKTGLENIIREMFPIVDPKICKFEEQVNPYGRYIPVREEDRAELVTQLAYKDIYCLGRYAEWTYKRTDHVVKDAVALADQNKIIAKKGEV